MAQQHDMVRKVQAGSDGVVVIDLYGGRSNTLKLRATKLGASFDATVAVCVTALVNQWRVVVDHEDDQTVNSVMIDMEQV